MSKRKGKAQQTAPVPTEKAKIDGTVISNQIGKTKKPKPIEKSFFNHKHFQVALLLFFCFVSFSHFLYHVRLQENLRWWSTRTQIQKEASLYSEQAMYYRYAKRGSLASSLSEIWQIFTNDQKVQYPEIINPLQAYNVFPELVISLMYQMFGSGDPLELYAQVIHFGSGIGVGFVFLIATYLSRNILGGFLTVFFWTIGHENVTRAWHAISLRESSAMPFWFIQLFVLTIMLQDYHQKKVADPLRPKPQPSKKNPSKWSQQFHAASREKILLAFYWASTVLFMLSWQFAQFILLTQAIALFLMFYMGYLDKPTYLRIIVTLEIGLLSTVFFQFGNMMLFNSVLFNLILVVVPIAYFIPRELLVGSVATNGYVQYYVHLARVAVVFVAAIALCLATKYATATLLHIEDDGHIFDILRSKFTSFSTFDTKMYMKQPEYRIIDADTIRGLRKVFLLESSLIPVVIILFKILFASSKENHRVSPVILFHWFQYIAACILAILIMRLKVFSSPYMCIMCALWLSPEATNFVQNLLTQRIKTKKNESTKTAFYIQAAITVAVVSYVLFMNYSDFYAYSSKDLEFHHPELQDMLEWVSKNTPKDAIFSSEMVLTSSLFLSADRTVTNHPHYESVDIRNKTQQIYKMFFCTPEKAMWNILQQNSGNKITHLLIARGACQMSSVLHNSEEPCDQSEKFCSKVMSDPPQYSTYFKRVYSNPSYQIFTVLNKK